MAKVIAERILDVAQIFLIENGFGSFSYAHIADVVQIRKSSIHHHFPTKAALVVAVLRRHTYRMEQDQVALLLRVGSPLERLRLYLRHWETCIRKRSEGICIAALLGAELPSLPPEVRDEVRKHFISLHKWLVTTLREAQEVGEVKLTDTASIEAEILRGTVHGAMISARVNDSGQLFRKVTSAALQRLQVA